MIDDFERRILWLCAGTLALVGLACDPSATAEHDESCAAADETLAQCLPDLELSGTCDPAFAEAVLDLDCEELRETAAGKADHSGELCLYRGEICSYGPKDPKK